MIRGKNGDRGNDRVPLIDSFPRISSASVGFFATDFVKGQTAFLAIVFRNAPAFSHTDSKQHKLRCRNSKGQQTMDASIIAALLAFVAICLTALVYSTVDAVCPYDQMKLVDSIGKQESEAAHSFCLAP